MYDSYNDTMAHIEIIQFLFDDIIIPEIEKRKTMHDQSKLISPEKETYDKFIPLLKTAKYGSEEYYKLREEMSQQGTGHHYKVNRHHPEHFENGVNDMNLIDIIEMVADWAAASKRSDTSFEEGIKINKKKFNISDELYNIILNTYNDLLK